METLAVGGKVVLAQHEASFESASAFRAALARLLGQSPSQLQSDKQRRATWITTPLGDMIAVSSQSHLRLFGIRGSKRSACRAQKAPAGVQRGYPYR
ncbi:protein of unknown function (plasmid) [Agrobacterium pusense]|uniref:Uncharacterized protein n=1 Tax=Agrobacterium pusense TaxID=648995 RepID=U4QHB8_9HYPH|nr:protein of unknown function [Agrobacterium pusense]